MFQKTYFKNLAALCCLCLLWEQPTFSQSQTLQMNQIPLDNLSAFKPVDGNWKLVEDVFFSPFKNKKPQIDKGGGVLVNIPSDKEKADLFTKLEHGDIELELEYMIAKGSNSGVYLQGRYEVQILDSWGNAKPKFSDAGGIYQRWNPDRSAGNQGFEGHPPLVNVSKAPGLWQHYRIIFQAPKFNAQGQKVANARFVKVYHNGVLVHDNVEVTGPTRSAAFEDERPLGPLMIQGDHGPVAIRNIRYKSFTDDEVKVRNIRYATYAGEFQQIPDFRKLKPQKEGEMEYIHPVAGANINNYAGQINGTIDIPKSRQYLLEMQYSVILSDPHFAENPSGGADLTIAGKKILELDQRGKTTTALVDLSAGPHPFTIRYYSRITRKNNSIKLYIEGDGIKRQAVGISPLIPEPDRAGAITLVAINEPIVQRSFLQHGAEKRTHAVSVGEPGGANYSLDLKDGALLQIWRGPFLETTPMWHERGDDQLGIPMGSIIRFSGAPSLAILPGKNTAWPDSMTIAANYKYEGYSLDNSSRPTFKYTLGDSKVREQFIPENGGRQLKRHFSLEGNTQNMYSRIATGKIKMLEKGLYSINDKQYLIRLDGSNAQPLVRNIGSRQELLLPAKDSQITYTIIW